MDPEGGFGWAYWQALDRVYGEKEARVIRAVLLARAESGGEDWERVHRQLQHLLEFQARRVMGLAQEIHRRHGPTVAGPQSLL